MVKRLAALGATTPDGLNLSPHPDSERGKPGPSKILLRKYRQALGVMASRVNADLKIKRVRFCRPDAHRAAQFAQSQRTWYSQSGHRHSRHPWFSSHGSDPCNLTFPQIGAFPISCLNAGACPISCLTAARRFGPVRACVIGSRVAAILILLVLTLLVMHKKLKGEETELGDKIGVYT